MLPFRWLDGSFLPLAEIKSGPRDKTLVQSGKNLPFCWQIGKKFAVRVEKAGKARPLTDST